MAQKKIKKSSIPTPPYPIKLPITFSEYAPFEELPEKIQKKILKSLRDSDA